MVLRTFAFDKAEAKECKRNEINKECQSDLPGHFRGFHPDLIPIPQVNSDDVKLFKQGCVHSSRDTFPLFIDTCHGRAKLDSKVHAKQVQNSHKIISDLHHCLNIATS